MSVAEWYEQQMADAHRRRRLRLLAIRLEPPKPPPPQQIRILAIWRNTVYKLIQP